MDANERAHIEYLDYRRSEAERRQKATEDALRSLMLALEESDDIPLRVRRAAETVRDALDTDPDALTAGLVRDISGFPTGE